jgi:hypothetical protein
MGKVQLGSVKGIHPHQPIAKATAAQMQRLARGRMQQLQTGGMKLQPWRWD